MLCVPIFSTVPLPSLILPSKLSGAIWPRRQIAPESLLAGYSLVKYVPCAYLFSQQYLYPLNTSLYLSSCLYAMRGYILNSTFTRQILLSTLCVPILSMPYRSVQSAGEQIVLVMQHAYTRDRSQLALPQTHDWPI